MFKKTIAMVMVATTIMSASINVQAKDNKMDWYRLQAIEIETEANQMQVVDSEDLTYEQIIHRKGTILVERIIGKVKNNKKDGRVLNVPKNEKYYNYISYKDIDCKKGDIIVTYLLYNPETNGEDDIIARWDYKLR